MGIKAIEYSSYRAVKDIVTVYRNGIYRGFISVGEWKRWLTVSIRE